MALMRGEPSRRSVAIVLFVPASKTPRTRAANAGAVRLRHRPTSSRGPSYDAAPLWFPRWNVVRCVGSPGTEVAPGRDHTACVGAGTAKIADLLAGAPDRTDVHPAPQRWTATEYGAHVRDVLLNLRDRLVVGLIEDRPTFTAMYRDERVTMGLYRPDTADAVRSRVACGQRDVRPPLRRDRSGDADPGRDVRRADAGAPDAALDGSAGRPRGRASRSGHRRKPRLSDFVPERRGSTRI